MKASSNAAPVAPGSPPRRTGCGGLVEFLEAGEQICRGKTPGVVIVPEESRTSDGSASVDLFGQLVDRSETKLDIRIRNDEHVAGAGPPAEVDSARVTEVPWSHNHLVCDFAKLLCL